MRKSLKGTITAAMTGIMILGSTMTVCAQPVTIGDVTFDAEYYAAHNPDVVAALGTDANALFQHYIAFGQAEGRLPYEIKETVATEASTYVEQVVALVNAERAKAGVPMLTIDPAVMAAADVRAKENTVEYSHTRPDGRKCATALKDLGISYRGYGENIAFGQKTPEEVMTDWMNSDGHRANILNPKFKNIGVGYCEGDTKYWVQMFTY